MVTAKHADPQPDLLALESQVCFALSLNLTLTVDGRRLRKQALSIPPAIMNRLGMDTRQLQSLHATSPT